MTLPRVSVQTEDFDLSAEVAALRRENKGVGAVCSFIGTVRDRNEGDQVSSMELEHYPGMTEKSIEAMVDEAFRRFNIFGARVIHRVGLLQPLIHQIVLVAGDQRPGPELSGLRIFDGLPQDAGAVLEEGRNPPGSALGGCAGERRRGAGALGHHGEQCLMRGPLPDATEI